MADILTLTFAQVNTGHNSSPRCLDGGRTQWLQCWQWSVCPLSMAVALASSLSSVLTSHPGSSDPSFLPPAGWRREPVAVENGCHDNGAQLYPFAVGESVSRPPPAGPHHADEGQHLCPWQLGVPAGNRHLPQPLVTHCNHVLYCNCPISGATLHNSYSPVALFVITNAQVSCTTIK